MSESRPAPIAPAEGTLGVLLPGMGAVATTFIAGVHAIRKGIAKPIGSITQMGTIRLGKRTEHRSPLVSEFVPLAQLEDLVFGGWDPIPDNVYEAMCRAQVLSPDHIAAVRPEVEGISPMPAVLDPMFVKNIHGENVKKGKDKWELAQALRDDIRTFRGRHNCARLVMVWCGSTEAWRKPTEVHQTVTSFENGLKTSHPDISPSQMYAYAALQEGVAFANGAPHLCVDAPGLVELARDRAVPIMGKDFKTGQTLMKTIIAPGLKARALGLDGWYSTNILGNRDGEVLDDPESFKSKEESKLGVLDHILQPALYPDLYGKIHHVVRINYYPPRGDNKEGWDSIDIRGWMGYPMQIKINFLCRDSILAAPLVLDLALFLDLATRANLTGIQEWLSFYFKSPQFAPGLYPEHDVFIQQTKLKNTLRYLMGEELITHLGREYYEE